MSIKLKFVFTNLDQWDGDIGDWLKSPDKKIQVIGVIFPSHKFLLHGFDLYGWREFPDCYDLIVQANYNLETVIERIYKKTFKQDQFRFPNKIKIPRFFNLKFGEWETDENYTKALNIAEKWQ